MQNLQKYVEACCLEKVEHALIVVIFAQIFGLLEVTSANIEAAGNPYNVEAKHLQDDENMEKLGDVWQCKDCLWETKYKTRLWEHVEAKHVHVQSSGYLLFQVLLIKETA